MAGWAGECDGGPAFPTRVTARIQPYIEYDPQMGPPPPPQIVEGFVTGMSLRDWFAGLALIGIVSGPRRPSVEELQQVGDIAVLLVRTAYAFSDEMLRERAREAETSVDESA